MLSSKSFNYTVDLQNFRIQAPSIFWNLVWHFKQFQLPYDFILAYEEKPFMKEFEMVNAHLNVIVDENIDTEEIRVPERNKSSNSESIWIIIMNLFHGTNRKFIHLKDRILYHDPTYPYKGCCA